MDFAGYRSSMGQRLSDSLARVPVGQQDISGRVLMSEFFCMDCRAATTLDAHGYCSRCHSDAIAPGFSLKPTPKPNGDWLERMIEEAHDSAKKGR